MRFAFSFFVVLLALSVSAVAGEDAFFSKDGESVTFISHNGTDLLRLHLKTRKVAKVNLGAEFKGQQLGPLCGGADGETLFVTAKGVFVHDAKGTRPLVTQPLAESLNIRSVFAAPATQ
ncbi:MAG: hypothetical protein JWO94_160, partial [Verrucomicrobiaceae bacterium]|nr:hypothetical protein [Verrucomicrobiaceae bacterium]